LRVPADSWAVGAWAARINGAQRGAGAAGGASAGSGRSFGSLRAGSGINYGAAAEGMGFAGMAARLTGAGARSEVIGTAKNPLVTMQVGAAPLM